MASPLLDSLTTTFINTMIRLYLDNPGIGEFTKEQIVDNLPRCSFYLDLPTLYPKDDCIRRLADIMREARDRKVFIVRVRGYYKVVNIKEVIERYHKRQNVTPPPFPMPATNKVIWGG